LTAELLASLLRGIDERVAVVAIVGQGYVGLPLALRATELGFRVVGYDTDKARIETLRDRKSYVGDIGDDEIASALDRDFLPTTDPRDLYAFDVAVITVPTPLRDGAPDLRFIEAAGRDIAKNLSAGSLVVLESTTYPGTTEEFLRPILEESGLRAGTDFFLGYSPERIDPGNKQWTLCNTPKVVAGIDAASQQAVERFYGALVDKVVPVGSTGEAELVKLLENTFRHVNIALVNELAVFAHELGVDVWSAIDAAATKPFGYMRFTPGPGVGGHCLPIDPSYLAWRVERRLGHRFRFVELANDVNRDMPAYVVSRVTSLLNEHGRAVRDARILLCGLAYKAGTSDWRESPSTVVADRLLTLGADVRVHDDHLAADLGATLEPLRVPCDASELEAADLVVLLVDHPDLPYDEICARARLVLDTKGALRGCDFHGEVL